MTIPSWQAELVEKYLNKKILTIDPPLDVRIAGATVAITPETDFLAALDAAFARGKADQRAEDRIGCKDATSNA